MRRQPSHARAKLPRLRLLLLALGLAAEVPRVHTQAPDLEYQLSRILAKAVT